MRRVLLYGSIARGEDGPRSDADIVIIVSRSPHRKLFKRVPEFLPYFTKLHIPIDLLAYTEAEIKRMSADGNPFIRRAITEGVELASAS